MNQIKVINEQTVLGKNFKIYGDFENPLFLAKDVAEWIDYSKTKEGFYQVSKMLANVDDDEKLTINILNSEGKAHNQSFLTENGLYEVLMLSRKPIAKQFKKEVKNILKTIRKHGAYMTENTIEKALTSPDFLIQLATKLKEEGYNVTKIGNNGNTDSIKTTIINRTNNEYAKEIKKFLGKGTLKEEYESTSKIDVTVILGSDY